MGGTTKANTRLPATVRAIPALERQHGLLVACLIGADPAWNRCAFSRSAAEDPSVGTLRASGVSVRGRHPRWGSVERQTGSRSRSTHGRLRDLTRPTSPGIPNLGLLCVRDFRESEVHEQPHEATHEPTKKATHAVARGVTDYCCWNWDDEVVQQEADHESHRSTDQARLYGLSHLSAPALLRDSQRIGCKRDASPSCVTWRPRAGFRLCGLRDAKRLPVVLLGREEHLLWLP